MAAKPETALNAKVLGLPVAGFGALDFNNVTVEAPVEFGETPRPAIGMAWQECSAALGDQVAAALVSVGADFVTHFSAASA